MRLLSLLFNGLLVGASGYAMYLFDMKDHRYAFVACALGLAHGIIGIFDDVTKNQGDHCSKVHQITAMVMEAAPMPLINMDLYLHSTSNNVAMGHSLFLVPLVYQLAMKALTAGTGHERNVATLIDLTTLGNIASVLYLAMNEDKKIYAGFAAAALLGRFGPLIGESFHAGLRHSLPILAQALLFIVLCLTQANFSAPASGNHPRSSSAQQKPKSKPDRKGKSSQRK